MHQHSLNQQLFLILFVSFSLTCLLANTSSAQIALGQVDDFSVAGDALGWVQGGSSATPPAHNIGLGPDGSAGHLEVVSGALGQPRLLFWNQTQWTGDYTSAGVSRIRLFADNRSSAGAGGGADINLRLALRGPSNDWYVTDAVPLADGSGWTSLLFDLDPTSLTSAAGPNNGAAAALASVERLELLSALNVPGTGNSPGVLQGDLLTASLRIDNITAIPEPSSMAMLTLTALSGAVVRRRR